MIQELTMDNFKGFSSPTGLVIRKGAMPIVHEGGIIRFGHLSLIIGTNASGKSNIRDGLRFIHGISRGYTLAEIIGEKYVEGGALQWKGIRGGVRETVTRDGNSIDAKFTITVTTTLAADDGGGTARYSITVDVGNKTKPPLVVGESLELSTEELATFRFDEPTGPGQMYVRVLNRKGKKYLGPRRTLRSDRPAVTQLPDHEPDFDYVRNHCKAFLRTIASVRFLDLDPNSLRRPSIAGQTILGDKGENLSSVLQAICADAVSKRAIIEWTRELTPLDVVDMKFPEVSLEGKIQLQLVEQGGREISAESASDGTLRFLAFAAAVLGTEPARFYFFEEIENGIHPNRAHLLINLLRTATREGTVQVVGTTHSPALLNFLDKEALRDASLVYRVGSVSKIRSFADIPALWQVQPGTRAGELHGSGWFENVTAFLESESAQ